MAELEYCHFTNFNELIHSDFEHLANVINRKTVRVCVPLEERNKTIYEEFLHTSKPKSKKEFDLISQ